MVLTASKILQFFKSLAQISVRFDSMFWLRSYAFFLNSSDLPHDRQTSSEVSVSTYIFSSQSGQIHLSFLHSYTNFSWKSAWRGITTDPRVTGKVLEQSKIGLGCKSLWRWREAVALQAGPLADLPYFAAAHSLAKIWCPHSTRSTKEILFSCHTTNRLVLKYALTVVDVPSHYQEAESLTSKYSAEVAEAFQCVASSARRRLCAQLNSTKQPVSAI